MKRKPQGGKCLDAEWKKARASKASRTAKANWWAAREQFVSSYATKGEAFQAGYKIGYARAYHAWRRHLAKVSA